MKEYGFFETPPQIARWMVGLAGVSPGMKVLEPGAGRCIFLRTIKATYPNVPLELYGIEINQELAKDLDFPEAKLEIGDYLLWEPNLEFDLIIGNPPYGTIGHPDRYPIAFLREKKGQYKRIFSTWQGKFNIYGAFTEKSVRLLAPNGTLIFITPASWMVLDEFSLLRELLGLSGHLDVYYMGKGVFPDANVSVVVFVLNRGGKGLRLFRVLPGASSQEYLTELLLEKEHYAGEIIGLETHYTREFSAGKMPLGTAFRIAISPRSSEFKSWDFISRNPGPDMVPVLNYTNLKPGMVDMTCHSGKWAPRDRVASMRREFIQPRIIVGRLIKNGKLVAAVAPAGYPWGGEVYHLIPKPGTSPDLEGLVDYLNSPDLQRYLTELWGDMAIYYTATQIKAIPVPKELLGLGLIEKEVTDVRKV
jgi:adenine-specific DNA-methyltransferase